MDNRKEAAAFNKLIETKHKYDAAFDAWANERRAELKKRNQGPRPEQVIAERGEGSEELINDQPQPDTAAEENTVEGRK